MSDQQAPVVLVVDDEVQIRRFLRAGLELDGFVVQDAETGADALKSVTLQQPILLGRERHPRAVERHHARGEVDGERARPHHRLAGRGAHLAAHGGMRASEQLRHAERLDHIVVGAAFQQAHLLGLIRAHGEHDQRHGRP